jgi:REP element-mobilizing transposase RayT
MDREFPVAGGCPGTTGPRARRAILASHLVLTGYGHWLPNDLRGSGSEDLRRDELKALGEILPGRQYSQPPREIVKEFYREAEPHLEHTRLWFDESRRDVIGRAFGGAAKERGYTIWACAICANHVHLVVSSHRDNSRTIWDHLAAAARNALHDARIVPGDHPVWSHRPYKVFLYTPQEVLGRILYVERNPVKEGLPAQKWDFVVPCPYRKG